MKRELSVLVWTWFIVLWLWPALAFCQKIPPKILRLLSRHDWSNALKLSESLLAKDSNDCGALYAAAIANLHEFSASKSLALMRKVLSICPNPDPETLNTLGQAFHANYLFDSAIATYRRFLACEGLSAFQRAAVQKLIEESQNAKNIYPKPSPYFVKSLGLKMKSYHPDHSPILLPDQKGLYFANREQKGEEYFEDIYEVRLQDDTTWTQARRIEMAPYQVPVSFFDGGKKLLIYRYSKHGNLYYIEKQGDKWSQPYPLKGINTPSFEGHGHIFAGGKAIVFSSNNRSKHADLDLFVSYLQPNGRWGKAQRLPPQINSPEDEDSPFMLPDGNTLFFSSKGHNSTGGYDVFKATRDPKTGEWSTAENLGHPVNTPRDDLYFTLDSTGSFGYISSNREDSQGGKDLYYIGITKQPEILGKVSAGCQALPHSKLTFRNPETGEDFITLSDDSGEYSLALPSGAQYVVSISSGNLQLDGYILEIPTATVASHTKNIDFQLPEPDSLLHNLALLDSPVLGASARQRIKHRFEGTVVDAEGNQLGKAIVSLSDDSGEILYKVPAEDNGHFVMNVSMESSEQYHLNIERNGIIFKGIKTISAADFQGQDSQTSRLDIILKDINKGDRFVMRNVYFDFNNIEIPYEFIPDLQRLANFLADNPRLKIKISGHADSQGDDAFNLWLSKQRAMAIMDFLVERGLDKSRISIKAYGATKPAVNAPSKSSHQFNRRCEIEIVGL